jgi:hypothetical protein
MRGCWAVGILVLLPALCSAQLRVVSWNTLDGPNATSEPHFRTVFESIAGDSINGIARRPDIISLQEQTSSSTQYLAGMLNSLYGVSSYVAVQP